MGWNGGGFGHMTFETLEGVAAWKAASVTHDQWSDWADWFETPIAPRFVVESQLAELRKLHDPTGHGYFVIDENAATIELAFDTGEDTVREFSGTIAATLRAAAEHGARGVFYFLGTAGAEYEFTYKLELANGLSTMETLNAHDIANVYEGEPYQAFLARVMAALGITSEGDLIAQPTVQDADADVDADAERAALKQKAFAFTASRKPAALKTSEPSAPADAPVAEDASVAGAAPAADAPATAKQPAVKKAVATKAAAKQPATKPAAKQPAAKQPATKPAAKKPAAKKPAAKKPAAKPATKKPATKKPAAKKPATKKPATKKPAAKQPATKQPATNKPAAKKPAAKK